MKVLDRMVELGFDYQMSGTGPEVRAAFGSDRKLTHETRHGDRRIALLKAAVTAVSGEPKRLSSAPREE